MSKTCELLYSAIEELKALEDKKWSIKDSIIKFGRSIVDELTKIPNWECLMQSCQLHYKEYPNEFFDWCSYEIGDDEENFNHLLVKKYYNGADPDGYVVFDINLKKSLESQVAAKMKALKDKKVAEEEKKLSKERQDYERLKKKFEGNNN